MYFRTNGVVRFVTVSERMQLTFVSLLLALLTWVIVTSVFFAFEQQILAAKEEKVQEANREYEAVSQQFETLKSDIEETARNLEQRQIYLQQLIDTDQSLSEQADEADQESVAPTQESGEQTGDGSDLISFVFSSKQKQQQHENRLKEIAYYRFELKRIENQQRQLAEVMILGISNKLAYIDTTLEKSGIKTAKLIQIAQDRPSSDLVGQGGPLVVFADSFDGSMVPSEPFARLQAHYNKLIDLEAAVQSMPVAIPAKKYYISSGFGARRDPFKKTWAQHHGLDMAGWWKTPIYASGNGIVTKAGRNGAYGNFIEIDHGNGFKSRYGHLSKIKVKRGQQVSVEQEIGLMGSTGRSTSPHLHYEIWFNGKPINPLKLFKAADDVLKIQRQEYTSS
ncbi:peptidoglycan DD-metalloendopeptidase family protein [Emcibacter sp.]|uniref:peptidoglycan DD-metalloendopeptidase family protein n=1 Tax=Emcibacter sp. TaxID=1979954 RepID=UPI002AA62265|nr:peptidoglycan DD-metalloendopeptidase family protein [Emcibacter sp.]